MFYLPTVKTNDYQCIDVIGKDLYNNYTVVVSAFPLQIMLFLDQNQYFCTQGNGDIWHWFVNITSAPHTVDTI